MAVDRTKLDRLTLLGPRFAIGFDAAEAIKSHAREYPREETGGLLFGTFTHGRYEVFKATTAPEDSIRTASSFWHGSRGVDEAIEAAHKIRLAYLGEWHTHPAGSTIPSESDHDSLKEVAEWTDVNEPIMMILGGPFLPTVEPDLAVYYLNPEGALRALID